MRLYWKTKPGNYFAEKELQQQLKEFRRLRYLLGGLTHSQSRTSFPLENKLEQLFTTTTFSAIY